MSESNPLRVAVLCSHRAPGIDHVLEDPNHGHLFQIVGCISSEESFPDSKLRKHGVFCKSHPIRRYLGERGLSFRNLQVRYEYDLETAQILDFLKPDVVVLSQYRYILTEPVLSAFPNRIIGIHDGDLTRVDHQGHRLFVGLRATRDAIAAGETETRSTVYFVDEIVHHGPLFLRSRPFPVSPLVADALAWGATEVITSYAWSHGEWMIRASWGPLLSRALEMLAMDHVRVAKGVAWVNGMPGPCLVETEGRCESPRGGPPPACPFLAGGERSSSGF